MSEHSMYQVIPVPDDEKWACLQCVMHADRDTQAAMLILDDGGPTGMCSNHAEVMDLEDLEEAINLFNEQVGL